MFTKYQNISKGIRFIERTSFPLLCTFKGDKSKVHTTHTLDLIYLMSSKYLKGYKSYWAYKLSPIKLFQGRWLKRPARESNHSCMRHTFLTWYTCLPNIIKISQRVSKLLSAQGFVYGWSDARLMAISPNLVSQGIKSSWWSWWNCKQYGPRTHCLLMACCLTAYGKYSSSMAITTGLRLFVHFVLFSLEWS